MTILQRLNSFKVAKPLKPVTFVHRRFYKVLAIETSCDDTSVAYLNHNTETNTTEIRFNEKETLDSASEGGIIPTEAHVHHQRKIGSLVRRALSAEPTPDVICATRGPGMLGSLSVGLNVAKGISIGLGRPLLGINHMLGHLLVPRLSHPTIEFPILSLLVSGGHTMLVLSKSPIDHEIVCNSIDIAVGDSLDKCGREIGIRGIMIGKEMERLVASAHLLPQLDDPIVNEIKLPNPLNGRNKSRLEFSFSPFITSVKNFLKLHPLSTLDQQQHAMLASKVQSAIFGHLLSKIRNVLDSDPAKFERVNNFICSGGVSANKSLRGELESQFCEDFENFYYPPLDLCTDNAVMIGWAGIELLNFYKVREGVYISNDLDIVPLRKWPLNDIEDVSAWKKSRSLP